MEKNISRRKFLALSAKTGTILTLGLAQSCNSQVQTKENKKKLYKAVIVNKPIEDELKKIKDAGFDGVEAGIVTPQEADESRKTADKLRLQIHSVLRGWAKFNSKDPNEIKESLDTTITSLKAAQAYGADAILLVPGKVTDITIPEPWDFKAEFDKKTGKLTSVSQKDNDRYRDYMDAHNFAYDSFQKAIRELIPIAEETKVIMAVENVWNNLLIDPLHMATFIDSFKSKWVRFYFDIGNHIKWFKPQDYINIMNKRIVKCHVKDFKLNTDGKGGNFVSIRDGSADWPAVRQALDKVGYNGWMTIEGSNELSLDEKSKRLDLIIGGN